MRVLRARSNTVHGRNLPVGMLSAGQCGREAICRSTVSWLLQRVFYKMMKARGCKLNSDIVFGSVRGNDGIFY